MSNPAPSSPLEIRRVESAREWATSDERVPVFTVVRDNPEHAEWLERKAAHDGAELPEGAVREPFPEAEPAAELRIEYTMPAKPNAGLALAFLKHARANSDMAASWLLEAALGSDGYDAFVEELSLEPDPEVASATMTSVVQFVAKRALGGLSGKA